MDASANPIFLSREQVRELDRCAAADYGLSTSVLMENAGRGAAAALLALGVHGPVVICCGKGNNGGDGLVIARHLRLMEIDVRVLLFANPGELSPAAAANWLAVERTGIDRAIWPTWNDADLTTELGRAEWAVDALYGIGLAGVVRPPAARAIATLNSSPARVFAVDVPSGLDSDTGQPLGAVVRARHTATFVAPKLGFANPAAAEWLGMVHVIDIGVPQELWTGVVPPHMTSAPAAASDRPRRFAAFS